VRPFFVYLRWAVCDMKRISLLAVLFLFSLAAGYSQAARVIYVSQSSVWGSNLKLDPPSCGTLNDQAIVKLVGPVTCDGLDEAVKNGGNGSFSVTVKSGQKYTAGLNSTGSCTAGKDAGSFSIPIAYTKPDNHDLILQTIHDPLSATASAGGCEIKGVELGGCFWHEPVNGAVLKECLVYFKETGVNGGAESPPDTSAPDYNGTGSGGGTGGGGTDPGTGGGGTDPGTGGGGTGGGGTGGGGTGGDGGGTGGGGTGGGGTGGGDTQQNCGAPGQPACKIDETGTPTGSGLFDALMKLVDGIGSDREKGLDDLKNNDGKDTSLSFTGIDLPAGVCVDPVVQFPFVPGSFAVPICGYLDILRPLFTAFFGFSFVFAVISMISRTTLKS
jgi:hypothetical protein